MRHLIFSLSLLFVVCACAPKSKAPHVIHFESGFSLYPDTIYVDIKGEMTHALKYHDKFYVLFEQRVLKYGGYGKRWLYVFSNGAVEKIVDFPKDLNTTYLDFYVKNDSVIIKPYMDEQCYYLDLQNFAWVEIDKTDDLIFEDEKYRVYSLDFGEWGGKTWFKDNITGIEYAIEATTPLINKIDTAYYLTSPFKILRISNPQALNKCNEDVMYENIKTNHKYASWYGEPIGFEIIYRDTTYNPFSSEYTSSIVSSFVWQDELLHIYETDTATFIAKVQNDSIRPIQKIGEGFIFYDWYYSYRRKNLNGNNELLKFYTTDEQSFGLMDVVGNDIHVYYFANKAELTPKSIGTAKADSIFIDRLNLILSDLGVLKLKDVGRVEQKWGTFDITPNHKIGVGECWNPRKYEIDTCKSYLVQEDSLISNSIIYYSSKASDFVRTVSINWDKTDVHERDYEEVMKEMLQRKLAFLERSITQSVGSPIASRSEKNYTEKTWKTSRGLQIELQNMKNYNHIRLVIFEL